MAETAPGEVNVVLMSGDLLKDQESVPRSFGFMVRGLLQQDPELKATYAVGNRTEFFEALRKIKASGRKIRRLLIAGHGTSEYCLILRDDVHDPDASLSKRDFNIDFVRTFIDEQIAKEQDELTDISSYDRQIAEATDDGVKQQLRDEQNEVRNELNGTQRRLVIWKKRHEDILSVDGVMAPNATVTLLSCFAGDPDAQSEDDPDEARTDSDFILADTTFLRSIGACLLQKGGGRIVGPSGIFWTAYSGEEVVGPHDPTGYVGELVDGLCTLMLQGYKGLAPGEFIGFPEHGWVSDDSLGVAEALPVGSILVSGDSCVIKAAAMAAITIPLLAGTANFKGASWGPLSDTTTMDLPKPVACGSATAPRGGLLRLTMRVAPPSPADMTESNTNATLSLVLGRPGRNYRTGSGSWLGSELRKDIPIALACTVTATLDPPLSTGDAGGGRNPPQSASFSLELVPGGATGSGVSVRMGDTITTDSVRALIRFKNGFRCMLRRDTEVKLVPLADGKMRIVVEHGGLHLINDHSASEIDFDIRFGDCIVTPKGTTLDADYDKDNRLVRVVAGALSVPGGAGDVTIKAGSALHFDKREILPLQQDDIDDRFYGWPLASFPAETGPVSPTVADAPVGAPVPPPGWRWLPYTQIGSAPPAHIAADSAAVAVITTPPDCGWDRFERLSSGPALATCVTGDFDIEVRIDLAAGPKDTTLARFFVYAPGSNMSFAWNRPDAPSGFADDMIGALGLLRLASTRLDFVARDSDPPAAELKGPVWLRVARRGAKLTVAAGADGESWSQPAETDVGLAPETIWVGLRIEHASGDRGADAEQRGAIVRLLRLKSRSWTPTPSAG